MVRSGIWRSNFQDAGLRRRFAILLLEKLWTGIEQTIPFVSQDRASTKAACQFLSTIASANTSATGLTTQAY